MVLELLPKDTPRAQTHTRTHARARAHAHTRTHTHTHTHTHTPTHAHTPPHARTHARTHTHTHTTRTHRRKLPFTNKHLAMCPAMGLEKISSRKGNTPGKPPTQIRNSLHKQFGQTLSACFLPVSREKGDSLYKLSRTCLRKLCFYLGGCFFLGGSSPLQRLDIQPPSTHLPPPPGPPPEIYRCYLIESKTWKFNLRTSTGWRASSNPIKNFRARYGVIFRPPVHIIFLEK